MNVTRDDLVHYGIPEGFFVVKVVVQRILGNAGSGQNGIQVSAPIARAVYLLEGSLHIKRRTLCTFTLSKIEERGSTRKH